MIAKTDITLRLSLAEAYAMLSALDYSSVMLPTEDEDDEEIVKVLESLRTELRDELGISMDAPILPQEISIDGVSYVLSHEHDDLSAMNIQAYRPKEA